MKYQKEAKSELIPFFREILDKPAPKSIILTCVDSRLVASQLLNADPGAYFMIRTPGNFIPKYESSETSVPSAIPAALELACVVNNASTIAVIGHSDCKTLNMLYDMRKTFDQEVKSIATQTELKKWLLANGKDTIEKFAEFENSGFKKKLTFSENHPTKFEAYIDPDNIYGVKEKFSQINTLEQLKNVNNYNFLKQKMSEKSLKGHALWLDVQSLDVYMFSYVAKRFIIVDESTYEKLYKESCLSS